MMTRFLLPFLLYFLVFAACNNGDSAQDNPTDNPANMTSPSVSKEAFGTADGQAVSLYTLTNAAGNSVKVTDYGGIITSIRFDDEEMVIGYDKLDGYLGENPYYGALIGRYGNRIANARFELDGEMFDLVPNENGNQLHGGTKGFDKYVWSAKTGTTDNSARLTLRHASPDGDMGFPGELVVNCLYEWTNDNELRLTYEATTTKNTIVNLTNHTYFNISSADTMTAQTMRLNAERYTPVDDELIPYGQNEPVAGTPFDFRTAKPIGRDIRSDHPQVALANGYDHNWELAGYDGSLREFALLTDPASGRRLRCFTTEPGVQIFTTNFPAGKFTDRGGKPLPTYGAICLETQHFPDSPNQASFKTPRLDAGAIYRTETVYRFEKE